MKYDFNRKIEEQSREYANTHDMLIEALEGQVYIKETFHKVNTNQVTGEALKKVSVGGKGGFGSQGDARDQEKQVSATSRVMVLSGPSQEAFDRNATLEQTVVGWKERVVPYTGHVDWVPVYSKVGETVETETYVPSHIFGEKEIKGLTKFQKTLGRDYDEFVHTNELDPSDHMRSCAFYLKGDALKRAQDRYDELCGYKGAHLYVGLNGYEQRRYRFTVECLLNQKKSKQSKGTPYKGTACYMNWEASSYNHNKNVYKIYNDYYYNKHSDEWLDEQMRNLDRKDCVQFLNWQLGEPKPWDWTKERVYNNELVIEPSEEFLQMKDAADSLEKKRRLDAMKNAPDLSDWKIVYKWELTKQGKVMFANEKI